MDNIKAAPIKYDGHKYTKYSGHIINNMDGMGTMNIHRNANINSLMRANATTIGLLRVGLLDEDDEDAGPVDVAFGVVDVAAAAAAVLAGFG
jgi:hypothetical protein